MSRTVDDFAEQTCRMMTVLYKLGHLDSDNVIQTKGRGKRPAPGEVQDTARSQRLVQRGAALQALKKLQRRIAELDARGGSCA